MPGAAAAATAACAVATPASDSGADAENWRSTPHSGSPSPARKHTTTVSPGTTSGGSSRDPGQALAGSAEEPSRGESVYAAVRLSSLYSVTDAPGPSSVFSPVSTSICSAPGKWMRRTTSCPAWYGWSVSNDLYCRT